MKHLARLRANSGTTIAEFAPTLLLLFCIFTFPLIMFGTLAVRWAFFYNAARLAATQASQCKSFMTNYSSSQPSAVNVANQVATQSISGFSGITMTNITTSIAICPLSGSSVTRQTTALAKPADTNTNSYNVEVLLTGKISPLIAAPNKIFGSIPGLTGPITTSARSSVYFENPQGLNQ